MGDQVETRKRKAAVASLLFNVVSTLVKLIAAALTGSVALLSEAIHSTTDVIASAIALVSVRVASAPPDEEHPYGHGKVESLAGFGESLLLLLIVCYIIFESVHKLMTGGTVQRLDLGMVIMAASAIGALAVGIYVARVGRETGSLALQSNGQHLHVDAITSAGVFGALALTQFTGWKEADAIVAILLALWIGYSAWKLSSQAFHQLIDRRLPDEELERVRQLVRETPEVLGCHRLRTRLSGNERYIDMHIVVPNEWSVVRAHDVADQLEKRICRELSPAHVVVHVDPFDEDKVERRNME